MSTSLFKFVAFLTVFIGNDLMLLVRFGEFFFTAEVLYLEIIGIYVDIDCFNVFSKYIFIWY